MTVVHGNGVFAINGFYTFRRTWNGACDECEVPIINQDLCWFWVGEFFSPVLHVRCFEPWVEHLRSGLREALRDIIEAGRKDIERGDISYPVESVAREKAWQEKLDLARRLLRLGTFMDYVNHWTWDLSSPAERLSELYDSIGIWEVYKRLCPDKPHRPFRREDDTSCACPHETGRSSLSMSINASKDVFFCFHKWEGGTKMDLYCEIRGLSNRREDFHRLKRMMVWEFRGEDPYAKAAR